MIRVLITIIALYIIFWGWYEAALQMVYGNETTALMWFGGANLLGTLILFATYRWHRIDD